MTNQYANENIDGPFTWTRSVRFPCNRCRWNESNITFKLL